MAEFAAKDLGECVQRRMEHPSGELEFGAVAALGLGRQVLGVGHRGGQGAALLNLAEALLVLLIVSETQCRFHLVTS